MNNLPAITTLVFGILAIVGGAIGYKQAGSKISLISGVISGLFLLIGAYLLLGNSSTGIILSRLVSLLLVIVFSVRLSKTRKFMPAGLMVILGLVNLAILWNVV